MYCRVNKVGKTGGIQTRSSRVSLRHPCRKEESHRHRFFFFFFHCLEYKVFGNGCRNVNPVVSGKAASYLQYESSQVFRHMKINFDGELFHDLPILYTELCTLLPHLDESKWDVATVLCYLEPGHPSEHKHYNT